MNAVRALRRKDWLEFDRSDRVTLMGLLGLAVLATAVAQVIGPIIGWMRGDALRVSFTSPITVPELDAVGQAYSDASYDLVVADPTTSQRLFDLVPGVLLLAIVAVICWSTLRLLRDIGAGEPFSPRNVRRLRTIAGLLLIGVPVHFFTRLPLDGAILSSLDLGTLPAAAWIELPWLPFVLGMCVALVAEAFKTGARLREDSEGLI